MRKLFKFISYIIAGFLALGIIAGIVFCSAIISWVCACSFASILAIMVVMFFIIIWICVTLLESDKIDISFKDDEDDWL